MAIINKKDTDKYGVVNASFMESIYVGKNISDYSLDSTDFASTKLENGMLVTVDHFAKTVKLPTNHTTGDIYLHDSNVVDYEGKGAGGYYIKTTGYKPRLRPLAVGDTFETDDFEWDDATYADFGALKTAITASAVFGETNASGHIRIVASATTGAKVELKVLGAKRLPTGVEGLEFRVNKIG